MSHAYKRLFEKLFSPLNLGNLTLANRIQVTPHELKYLKEGLVTDTLVNYYEERARGGAGLLEISQIAVKEAGDWVEDSPKRHPFQNVPEIVPGLKKLADAVHPYGAKVFMEVAAWPRVVGNVSIMPLETGIARRELTYDDIREVQEAYRTAAQHVKRAGFDGIDLHGTHGALIEHFYSPATNKRTDRYGGSVEKRLTFLLELIDIIRGDIGDDLALGMRLCADEHIAGGVTPDHAARLVELIDGKLDFINVDSGSTGRYEALNQRALQTQPLYVGQAYGQYMSEPIMKVAKKTKIGLAGRITDPVVAESILEKGFADYVGMTRALIADPYLPRKAKEGRLDEIRPCIGTLQDCWGRSVAHDWPMHCTVNPAVGLEETRARVPNAAEPKKILIVGGGVAGLEAARVSAERGHQVVVYERQAEVGGQVNLAKLLPGRSDIGAIIPWYKAQLKRSGARLEIRKEVSTAEEVEYLVEEEKPDLVIIATGSSAMRTGIQMVTFDNVPGWDGPNVKTIDEILSGPKVTGDVVVADSTKYILGPGVAEYLSLRGARVTLVTPHTHLSPDLVFYNQLIHVFKRLRAIGVDVLPLTWLRRIDADRVVLFEIPTGGERVVKADAVVINTGREQEDRLFSLFRAKVRDVKRIGDCNVAGGTIRDAIDDGFEAGLLV